MSPQRDESMVIHGEHGDHGGVKRATLGLEGSSLQQHYCFFVVTGL